MSAGPPPRGPDFVVLTGFLGSGKTTLLRDFLRADEAGDTAVIVNEVGEIGLDGAILREVGDGVSVATLANGCICCRAGDDLAATVEALLAAERPEAAGPLRRIVLETSGLAKPGPVLRGLAPLAAHRMPITVVATFDAERGAGLAAVPEAAAQWTGAQRIVVTKADRVTGERLRSIRNEIAGLNPLAETVATADREAVVRAAFQPVSPNLALPRTAEGQSRSGLDGRGRVETQAALASQHDEIGAAATPVSVLLIRQTRPVPFDDLAAWLDNLAGALGERLLRLKGLIEVEESLHPLLIESVGTVFSAPRPFRGPHERGPFLVLIGRDLVGGELDAVEPRLPLHIASWANPGPFARQAPRKPMRAEAV